MVTRLPVSTVIGGDVTDCSTITDSVEVVVGWARSWDSWVPVVDPSVVVVVPSVVVVVVGAGAGPTMVFTSATAVVTDWEMACSWAAGASWCWEALGWSPETTCPTCAVGSGATVAGALPVTVRTCITPTFTGAAMGARVTGSSLVTWIPSPL